MAGAGVGRATAGALNRPAKTAFIALMVIRVLCAALWTCIAVLGGGGFFLLIPAWWNVMPGFLALWSVRVAVWLVLISDAFVIALERIPDQ